MYTFLPMQNHNNHLSRIRWKIQIQLFLHIDLSNQKVFSIRRGGVMICVCVCVCLFQNGGLFHSVKTRTTTTNKENHSIKAMIIHMCVVYSFHESKWWKHTKVTWICSILIRCCIRISNNNNHWAIISIIYSLTLIP